MQHNILCEYSNEVFQCKTQKTEKHFSDAKQCRLVVR